MHMVSSQAWPFAGCAIAQVAGGRFPTAEIRFDPRLGNAGFVVDRVALGQVSSECFDFPCQFSCHQPLHIH
jgi:hypothetical protein